MNGKPETQPSNHVEWANGFKSNMPDWPTARRCAHSEMMLAALKSARTLLYSMDLRADQEWNHVITQKVFDLTLENVTIAIDLADGLDIVKQAFTMPPPPGFPKPPGVK